ncbi:MULTISPECIES: hypothetical protein [Sorangium]|uniref:Uncharacterized protein n=1 Tax=Sorangium cellulosum TaxID=56 RepID=A0A4P2QSD6_SORCE|nr:MULTISPECIES: hypothetical protein [Sorangium]AUX33189.1 uncharacterized protein SOCE836_053430 [Sorangium cellulosum]AUX33246.1 uncharacterized protein SOCE836_054000 [Sorangium cellulosum]WCQ92565.1 hypothetical protein NQZ70_05306 [Sorangium sp. Soce836]
MDDKDEGPRNFGVVLSEIDGGALIGELGEELQKVVKATSEKASATCRQASGELVIKLSLKTDEKGRVEVGADIKTKLPAPVRSKSLFYATDGGNLTATNPHQAALPFREVAGGKQEAKDVIGNKGVKAL